MKNNSTATDIRDELKVTDAELFANLRPEQEGMETILLKSQNGDTQGARSAFVDYFMSRSNVTWSFDWRGRTAPVQDPFFDTLRGNSFNVPPAERALSLLDDVLLDPHGGRTPIDDLDAIPDHLMESGGHFNYAVANHYWPSELAEAWSRTRDERFAAKLIELMHRFRAKWPLLVTQENPSRLNALWAYCPGGKPDWPVMCIGKTARNFMDALYMGVLESPAFSTDDRFLFLKTLWIYAWQFTRIAGKLPFTRANHHLYEVGTISYIMGVMLPEFKGFPEMVAAGRQVINKHLQNDFLPSGAYSEHSSPYNLIMWMYFCPWEIAHANGIELLAPENREVLRRWGRWLADMTRPDGDIALFGDGNPIPTQRFLEWCAALCGDAEAKGVCDILGNDKDFLISPTLHETYEACAAQTPDIRSAVYEDKGWVILRDGWAGDEASHFVLSAPRPTYRHGHWDMGSFTLFTHGRDFIGDPASYIYNGYFDAERRGYCYSMGAHNVLTVDDDELMQKRALYPIWTGDVPPSTVAAWHLGEAVDFVTVYHDGYTPKRHVREVFFKKHGYWLILDYLSPEEPGKQPQCWIHTIRRFLHFSFGVSARIEGDRVIANHTGAELMIVPATADDLSMRLYKDEILEPEREKLKAESVPDVLEIKNKIMGKTVMGMLIYPADRYEGKDMSLTITEEGDHGPVHAEVTTDRISERYTSHTLMNPDRASEEGAGVVVNTFSSANDTTEMPAQWTELSRYLFDEKAPFR